MTDSTSFVTTTTADLVPATTTTLFDGRNLTIGSFELTPIGMRVADGMKPPTFAEWEGIGVLLTQIEKAAQWWIGDWMLLGESDFSERASQAVGETGLQVETVKQYAWVAERIPPDRRRPELTFTHHRAVAALPKQEQAKWLSGAIDKGWSATKLVREIQGEVKTRPADECWLLVRCTNTDDRNELLTSLEATGRTTRIP